MVAQGKRADTFFAPAERAERHVVRQSLESLESDARALELLEVSQGFLLVLNAHRQIVYANKAMLDFLASPGLESILGKTPGEALGCLNCPERPGGCGTGEACRNCGAVITIMGCVDEGKKCLGECRIVRNSAKGFQSLDLRVCAAPIQISGEDYIVFTATDIGDEKRRRLLESAFLHEIKNSAGNVLTISGLLKDGGASADPEVYEMLHEAANSLVSEIDSYRILYEAENGELKIHPVSFGAMQFAQKLARTWNRSLYAQDKGVVADGNFQDFALRSDPAIFERALGNLIKNALEASQKGQMVSLACGLSENGGAAFFKVRNRSFMERDAQLRIFQRSFSTKDAARGIGTYMSRLLVERYLEGSISFASSPEAGTEFIVNLPLELSAEDKTSGDM